MEYIKLNKKNTLKIGIRDEDGKDTGNYLEFDLTDVSLPTKYQEMIENHNRNVEWFNREKIVIQKRKDFRKKGKLLTQNEEALGRILKEFYAREMTTYDMFLGEGGTKKLLNGRNPYIEMFFDIDEYVKSILPLIKSKQKDIETQIKDLVKTKYKVDDGDVLDDK